MKPEKLSAFDPALSVSCLLDFVAWHYAFLVLGVDCGILHKDFKRPSGRVEDGASLHPEPSCTREFHA